MDITAIHIAVADPTIDASTLSLLFRVVGLLGFFVVLYISISRHLTHYIVWLAIAAIFFVAALVIGGLGRQDIGLALEYGDQLNGILTFTGMIIVGAIVMTMWNDDDLPLENPDPLT